MSYTAKAPKHCLVGGGFIIFLLIVLVGHVAANTYIWREAEDWNLEVNTGRTDWCGAGGWSQNQHLVFGNGHTDYQISFPVAGTYHVWLRYASEHVGRATNIYLDSTLISANGTNSATGGWCGAQAIWEFQTSFNISTTGTHTLRLDAIGPFWAHVDTILLTTDETFVPPDVWSSGGGFSEADNPEVTVFQDHFKCYKAKGNRVNVIVDLEDQFGFESGVKVREPKLFCNPVAKTHAGQVTEIGDPTAHLMGYKIKAKGEKVKRLVSVTNQFGDEQILTVKEPKRLLVPSEKDDVSSALNLDHFKCYKAKGDRVNVIVDLEDQFGLELGVEVREPKLFCNPVAKTHDGEVPEILDPEAHLTCYKIKGDFLVENQFGIQTLDVKKPKLLCVPSEKIFFETVEGDEDDDAEDKDNDKDGDDDDDDD